MRDSKKKNNLKKQQNKPISFPQKLAIDLGVFDGKPIADPSLCLFFNSSSS